MYTDTCADGLIVAYKKNNPAAAGGGGVVCGGLVSYSTTDGSLQK